MMSKRSLMGWVFLVLLVGGCMPEVDSPKIPSPSVAPGIPELSSLTPSFPTPVPVNIATSLFTPTASPVMSLSLTRTIAPISSTLTRTPTVTPTMLPTLTLPQQRDYLWELLHPDSSCLLPCWWGMTLGETTWGEVQRLLLYMDADIEDLPQADNRILHDVYATNWTDPVYYNPFAFIERNGIVEAIDIRVDGYYDSDLFRSYWGKYSPEQILLTYGQPTEIRLDLSQGGESSSVSAGLYFIYSASGFYVIYGSRALEVNESGQIYYRVCPFWRDILWSPSLDLYVHPNDPIPFEQRIRVNYALLDESLPLEEAAGLSEADFYQQFMAGRLACVDTPMELWP